jgi:hypothetical protein
MRLAGASAATVRCSVRRGGAITGVGGSHVLLARGDVVVYRVRRSSFDTWWACSRAHGRRVLMGRDDSYALRYELYGPTRAFSALHTAGEWITAIHEEDNSPECGKYGETGCEGRSTALLVVNVAAGLAAAEPVYFPTREPARFLLSPEGGVVWLEESLEDELDGCAAVVTGRKLRCPARTLAQGHIAPASLHLSGTTLNWTDAGGAHSEGV